MKHQKAKTCSSTQIGKEEKAHKRFATVTSTRLGLMIIKRNKQ